MKYEELSKAKVTKMSKKFLVRLVISQDKLIAVQDIRIKNERRFSSEMRKFDRQKKRILRHAYKRSVKLDMLLIMVKKNKISSL